MVPSYSGNLKFLSPSVRVPLLVFAPVNASMLVPSLILRCSAPPNQLLGECDRRAAGRTRIPSHYLLAHVSVHCKIRHARY